MRLPVVSRIPNRIVIEARAVPLVDGHGPGTPLPAMCTLIVLHRCFPDAQLVVAANRDEFLDRPAEGPALREWNGQILLAPRDVQAGGTWLGLNGAGLFVGLTNRPVERPDPARRSRGLLVGDALAGHQTAADAARTLLGLPANAYNPFNVLVADGRQAFTVVYEEKPRVTELEPGAHVIGNADPDDRGHPKVGRILAQAEAVAAGSSADALDALAGICRTHLEHPPGAAPEDRRGDTCIHMGLPGRGGYGTRCSSLLRRGIRPEEDVLLWADGAPCENDYQNRTDLLRELDRATGTPRGETKTRNVA